MSRCSGFLTFRVWLLFKRKMILNSPELQNITIKELIDQHPTLIKLFMNMGLLCIGCPAETFHTVTDIAGEYGLNLNHLVDQINRAIQNTTISTNSRT
ncbi:DUF1858 domain-containing protein [Desulfobacter hydrogenophilus]|uniref:DUF1858 domain-containing protein n=2 Tax=Desulfobacter hydrogenophilus TaxID=2291 RepID=A0ABX5RAZ5_9BACT|nr:DUF1858 domain-containing protein [Desulfobacter hydrogenophilus]